MARTMFTAQEGADYLKISYYTALQKAKRGEPHIARSDPVRKLESGVSSPGRDMMIRLQRYYKSPLKKLFPDLFCG